MGLSLNKNDIILKTVVTDKAYSHSKNLKELTLYVHMHANKPQVKRAVEELFNVKVEDVRILVRKGKFRRVGRKLTRGSSSKKAMITLAQGYSLDMFDQAGAGVVPGKQNATTENNDKN